LVHLRQRGDDKELAISVQRHGRCEAINFIFIRMIRVRQLLFFPNMKSSISAHDSNQAVAKCFVVERAGCYAGST